MKKIKFDAFVESLRPDPNKVDSHILVQGFVGKSSEASHIRLYTDETLNNFYDLPEDAILHQELLANEVSPLGGSKLWLKADVVIKYASQSNDYLKGDLMQLYGTYYQDAAYQQYQQNIQDQFAPQTQKCTRPVNVCPIGGGYTIVVCLTGYAACIDNGQAAYQQYQQNLQDDLAPRTKQCTRPVRVCPIAPPYTAKGKECTISGGIAACFDTGEAAYHQFQQNMQDQIIRQSRYCTRDCVTPAAAQFQQNIQGPFATGNTTYYGTFNPYQ